MNPTMYHLIEFLKAKLILGDVDRDCMKQNFKNWN